jgi:hypothetical protein
MKKILLSSAVLLLFTTSMIVFQMSCKKDVTAQVAIVNTDTLYIYNCDTSSLEQKLTKKLWQVDYLTHSIGCNLTTFEKGVSNSTGINYDLMTFKFNDNNTGTTVQANGQSYSFTWGFTNTNQSTLKMTLYTGSSTVINYWTMFNINKNYLFATAAPLFAAGSNNNMESFRLIQVP